MFKCQLIGLVLTYVFTLIPTSGFGQNERAREYSMGDTNADIKFFYAQYQTYAHPESPTEERARARAIVNLCQIHDLIWFDPRYTLGPDLPGLRSRVASQLRRISKELTREQSRSNATADGSPRDSLDDPRGGDVAQSPGEDRNRQRSSESVLRSNYLTLLQFSGGPGQLAIYAGNHGPDADGQDLVQLIQSTIAPLTWDVNGGTGHVHFYRPQCLLVVRAGSEVHDQVGGLLQGLRDNQ